MDIEGMVRMIDQLRMNLRVTVAEFKESIPEYDPMYDTPHAKDFLEDLEDYAIRLSQGHEDAFNYIEMDYYKMFHQLQKEISNER